MTGCEAIRAALEATGGVYLSKPFDSERLLRVVRDTLDQGPNGSGRGTKTLSASPWTAQASG